MNKSIEYYNKFAKAFINDTLDCDMSNIYSFFEKYLNPSSVLLDLGFGSGRDSLYFLNKGYDIYSLDPSVSLCDEASKLGLPNIINLSILDIDYIDKFDGIFACASLLHINEDRLSEAFKKCSRALKNEGVIYASFKYGDFQGERNGRYYIDLNENTINAYLPKSLKIIDLMITEDVRKNNTTKWLNVILRKCND